MKITEALEKIFNVVDAFKKALSEDSAGGKKIVLSESIGLAIKGIGLIPAITAFSQLVDDWKSRDAEKKAEWIATFKERFDLADDELEKVIEDLVSAVLSLEGSITELAKYSHPDPPGTPPPSDED